MATVGIRLRWATVTAASLLVTASGLATAPAAHAATPSPSATAQSSPTPSTSTSTAETTGGTGLTLSPASARPGGVVRVTFDRWDFGTCSLYYDHSPKATGSCDPGNGHLTGSVPVPGNATSGTEVPITVCPTNCFSDKFTRTAFLRISTPITTTQSTGGSIGVVTGKRHHRHRHHTATSTSGHSTTLVVGGGVVVFLAAALGFLLLRRRPPTIGPPLDITLVPRPDPGVVTVDPATAAKNVDAHVTIRLRPDEGHCRVEAMQR